MGDDTLLRAIGTRIHCRRKELNITQEQLAEQMDVSVQMISNLELGKKAIRPENLVKICKALDISSDYILFGVHSQRESTELSEKIEALSHQDRSLIELLIDRFAE